MPTCSALKANGEICGKLGRYYQGNCGTHHNSKLARDPVYRASYERHQLNRRMGNDGDHPGVTQRNVARAHARRLEEEAHQAETRENKILNNNREIQESPSYSPYKIMRTANRIARLWHENNIPGYTVMQAYAALKHMSSTHIGFPELIRAATSLVCMGFGNHPDYESYDLVPEEERTQTLHAITHALVPYGNINIDQIIPEHDQSIVAIQARRHNERMLHIEQLRIQREQQEEQERIEEQQRRRAQLAIDLRERPVVFQRDPEGSINLAAFATDSQSVHRSSVQNSTHKMVLAILKRPLIDGQETLFEIINEFNNPSIIRWKADTGDKAITELTNDYYNTEAFSVIYGDVLDHVWAYIRTHINRKDLILRLAQEINDGISMCSNGKMARLMNVLQGYDDTLEQEAPREIFQHKIALLVSVPFAEREAAARALFLEYSISQEEQGAWLEPLLEA